MLVIPNKQKLVISTDAYQQVKSAIPHSKTFEHEGQQLVALHHGPEEAIVLKNIGLKVPEPIRSYYLWPGRFAPMDHQKDTAAFLTMNRKALCLNAPGCVDADTEYLSPQGWRRIADYEAGPVAQFDPETDEVSFVSGEYVKLPCADMVRIKTTYGVDQLLSPEHRCLVYSKRNPEKCEVLTAAALYQRERHSPPKSRATVAFSQAAVKTTFHFCGEGVPLTDEQLRVQVAVIADGHFPSPSGSRCMVRIKKERKKERMRGLLGAAGIPFKETAKDYPTATGYSVFTFSAPRREKHFTADWYACSTEQLRAVYDEVQHWDSCVSPNPNRGWRFSTRVAESADFVQFACAATGNTARVLQNHRERRGRAEVEYVVQVRPGVEMLGLQGGGSGEITSYAPSTDGYKYCFMVPSTFLVLRRNGCVFTTGNTGKTISSLWAADYLLEAGVVKRILIICPLSTVQVVWGREIYQHLPHRSFSIVTGSKEKRQQLLDMKAQYCIINHDGFTNMAAQLDDFDLVIYDEATALKSGSSQRYRIFSKWCSLHNPWLWLLTGTPISQNPTDAWTLARLVGSRTVPRSFTAFKEAVMQKVTTFKWVPRPNALDTCKAVLQPSIRFSLNQCKDLPETNYLGRMCNLSPAQAKAFKAMEEHSIVMFQNKDVTAANAAVALGKLLQICCGVLYGNDSEKIVIDAQPRYDVLTELLDEIGDKVIIFCPLRGAQEWLFKELTKSGYDVAMVNGDTSKTDRNQIFGDFQNTEKIRVLLAHPKVAAHGLTLTRSKDIIWYAPIYSLEQYEQACARIRRLTTSGKTNVWHLYATKFEAELYRRLKEKQSVLSDFLSLVKGINEDQ